MSIARRGVRAVVLREYGEPVGVERLDLEAPGPGEVLVRISASGVCHSDLHVVTGDLPLPLPMVLGHEGAGVVEQVGEGVQSPRVGERVAISWMPSCGTCYWCRKGRPDLCEVAAKAAAKGTLPGGGTRWRDAGDEVYQFSSAGTMAEAAVIPATCAIPVPEDVPLRDAALIGCGVLTGTGAALRSGKVERGELVAVIGTGGVGLHVIQGARLAGAERIIAIDPLASRREFARKLGATDVVDPGERDPLDAVLELTEGRGVDCAFEVVGSPATIAQAFNSTRKGGRAVVIGVSPPALEVSLNAFAFPSQSKTLKGCWYGDSDPARDVPELLAHYRAGRLYLGEVARVFALEEAQAAFAAMVDGTAARPVLVP